MHFSYFFITFYTMLTFIHLSQEYCKCRNTEPATTPPKVLSENIIKENINTKNATETIEYDNNYYLTNANCNYRPNRVAKIINPYQSSQDFIPSKKFGSVCLKCAACLAVTEQLNVKLNELKEKYTSDYEEFEEKGGPEELRSVCIGGFKNFDLRKYDGKSFVGLITPTTVHVSSGMDGLWTKKLRELCDLYLDHIDETSLFSIYKEENNVNITNFICTGNGIFRDCENVQYEQEEIPLTSDVYFSRFSKTMCVNCL